MKTFNRVLLGLVFLLTVFALPGLPAPFLPEVPVLSPSALRPGMKGYALTVVSGGNIIRFSVEVVSVVPQKGSPRNLILVKASGPVIDKTGGIAAGMSGSPVYINGKLIGAIGYGWNFSDHTLGFVTPYEDMASILSWPEKPVELPTIPALRGEEEQKDEEEKERLKKEEAQKEEEAEGEEQDPPGETGEDDPDEEEGSEELLLEEDRSASSVPLLRREERTALFMDGISSRSARAISSLVGQRGTVPGGGSPGDVPIEMNARLHPGEAITVLLAWGDVSIGSTGTVTAVGKDGRFIGFGHPFLGRGAVNFPVARSHIHSVIPSIESPFKIGSPLKIVGTVTQDRAEGIGGRTGYFTPSFRGLLDFTDSDRGFQQRKGFSMVPDQFMGAKLASAIYTGLLDELWGRTGQGTATVSLTLEGRGLGTGWKRTNMFFSASDIAAAALQETAELLDIVLLNPFAEVYPLGVSLGVTLTEEPRVMYIEGLTVKKDTFAPGEKIDVEVLLRPYRKKQVKKNFQITVPSDAGEYCEILVRGGGIEPLDQTALNQGWKTIGTFRQMFTELSALETENELILEFNYDSVGKKGPGKERKDSGDPVSKEEQELHSERKARRLKDGTLQIFKSEFVVDGLLRKIVTVKPSGDKNSDAGEESGE
ncbi:MAG: SpoIVB peptidase S55 domain-containing protein [Synergistaceae bacterium]|nr:SpoIVB peptidase S55 domain-containing protein [Synergistaceae bacterium]